MARLARFQLADGTFFVAEVDGESEVPRTMRGSASRAELIIESNETFEVALRNVKHAAEAMVDRLCSLATPPDELSIDFGIKLSAETGAVIAKASTEANFSISLKWKRSLVGKNSDAP